jgi:YbbR domain-containing protein
MLLALLRWLGRNIGTLLLAFILAVIVWVSAVVTNDPNEERIYPRPINLEQVGKDSNLLILGDVPNQVRVTLNAPLSIWNQLNNNPNTVQAWIDLSGLGSGNYTLPVKVRVTVAPVRVVQVDPPTVSFTLEPLVTQSFPIDLIVNGDPPQGYKKGAPEVSPTEVTVTGPQSQVSKVAQVRAVMDISGASETKKASLPLQAVDVNDNQVSDVTLSPKTVSVTQPINLEGGFKNVVVKVVTAGQISPGYRLTSISVTPPNVVVSSANPALVNELPGYVETQPVDVNGLTDDIEVRKSLNLPPGVSLVGEQSVLVQVTVAAIEGSLTVSVPVETLGLPPDMQAQISPTTVDVIVSGPLPVLDALSPASFRAVVDITQMTPGTYQIKPNLDLVPDQVQVDTILPDTVEVTLAPAPTPTPTSDFSLIPAQPGTPAATSPVTPTP